MRDLTIRQRRRQWKGHRKIDLASVQTFSPSCQVTQLLESRESSFVTEERGPRPTSGRDGSIYRLDGVFLNSTTCVGKAKKCTKMRNARAKLLFCKCKPNSLLSHLRSHPTRFFVFFFFFDTQATDNLCVLKLLFLPCWIFRFFSYRSRMPELFANNSQLTLRLISGKISLMHFNTDFY